MRHCPNPECPFRQKFGRPAEYRAGFETCSDCQAALVDGPGEAPQAAAPMRSATASDARARLVFTVAVMVAVAIAVRLPMIGVTLFDEPSGGGLLGLFGGMRSRMPGLFSIGLNPFIGAFQLVEVVALLPFLSARRLGTPAQRRPLTTAAMVLGLLLVVIQAMSLNSWAQGLSEGRFASAEVAPWLLVALVVPPLLLVSAAWLVDRRGLGNGFAVVLGASALSELVAVPVGLYGAIETNGVSPIAVVMVLAFYAGVAVLVVRLTAWPAKLRGDGPSWVPVPLSGLWPLSFAASAVSLPATLGLRSVEDSLRSSAWLYNGVFLFLVADFALILGFLFFRPAAVRRQWAVRLPALSADRVQEVARRALPVALGLSLLVLGGTVLVSLWLTGFVGMFVGSTRALLIAAGFVVVADLADEWRAWQRLGPLTAVAALHRVTEVEAVLLQLQAAGIEAHAKSARYRSTLRFFGPYVPIEIMVPAGKAAEAKALLESKPS